MFLPTAVIQALEALAENGVATIDGTDRESFREVASEARYENQSRLIECHYCTYEHPEVSYASR